MAFTTAEGAIVATEKWVKQQMAGVGTAITPWPADAPFKIVVPVDGNGRSILSNDLIAGISDGQSIFRILAGQVFADGLHYLRFNIRSVTSGVTTFRFVFHQTKDTIVQNDTVTRGVARPSEDIDVELVFKVVGGIITNYMVRGTGVDATAAVVGIGLPPATLISAGTYIAMHSAVDATTFSSVSLGNYRYSYIPF